MKINSPFKRRPERYIDKVLIIQLCAIPNHIHIIRGIRAPSHGQRDMRRQYHFVPGIRERGARGHIGTQALLGALRLEELERHLREIVDSVAENGMI